MATHMVITWDCAPMGTGMRPRPVGLENPACSSKDHSKPPLTYNLRRSWPEVHGRLMQGCSCGLWTQSTNPHGTNAIQSKTKGADVFGHPFDSTNKPQLEKELAQTWKGSTWIGVVIQHSLLAGAKAHMPLSTSNASRSSTNQTTTLLERGRQFWTLREDSCLCGASQKKCSVEMKM